MTNEIEELAEIIKNQWYKVEVGGEGWKGIAQAVIDAGYSLSPAPQEQVEMIAKKLHSFVVNEEAVSWESDLEEIREDCRVNARSILSLARPHLTLISDEEQFNLCFATPYKSMSTELSIFADGVAKGAQAQLDADRGEG